MKIDTHQTIDRRLCGEPIDVGEGYARVRLQTIDRMAADEHGLVHGGFVFGLADYAAMLAVNHPNVVLGRAEVRFLKPVVVGEELTATAEIVERRGERMFVHTEVIRADETVFSGEFLCYALARHVLAPRAGDEG